MIGCFKKFMKVVIGCGMLRREKDRNLQTTDFIFS